MRSEIIYSKFGHVLAVAGAVSMHAGLAAWAVQPSDPVVVPQQQIIQISYVAPSSLAQVEVKKEQEKLEEVSKTPPQDDGMRKVNLAEKPKKLEKPKEEVEKKEQHASAPTKITSGQQAPDSKLTSAAVTEPVFNADYLKNPPPVYPRAARKRNIEGKVFLDVLVSTKGAARQVRVARSSGSSLLDGAAKKAVEKWQFVPARRGSRLLEKTVTVPVEFKLKG